MHPESRKYLRFVAFGQDIPVQGLAYRSLHGFPGFHQGHGSGINHSSPSGDPDTSVSGRLANS